MNERDTFYTLQDQIIFLINFFFGLMALDTLFILYALYTKRSAAHKRIKKPKYAFNVHIKNNIRGVIG